MNLTPEEKFAQSRLLLQKSIACAKAIAQGRVPEPLDLLALAAACMPTGSQPSLLCRGDEGPEIDRTPSERPVSNGIIYAQWFQGHVESLGVLLQASAELDPQLANDLAAQANALAVRLRQVYGLPPADPVALSLRGQILDSSPMLLERKVCIAASDYFLAKTSAAFAQANGGEDALLKDLEHFVTRWGAELMHQG